MNSTEDSNMKQFFLSNIPDCRVRKLVRERERERDQQIFHRKSQFMKGPTGRLYKDKVLLLRENLIVFCEKGN